MASQGDLGGFAAAKAYIGLAERARAPHQHPVVVAQGAIERFGRIFPRRTGPDG